MKGLALGRTGARISQLALGTANFGQRWGHGADEAAAAAMLDAYLAAGGNVIDTADVYQFGESEEILGRLLQGRRGEVLLATKYTSGDRPQAGRLATGNSRRAMVASVEASLKRLQTDRIDLYWVHHPDAVTPVDEMLRGLDDLARAGKILYAGLSNFPAWRLARAATLAEVARTLPIAAAQFEYSLVCRGPEAELLPACAALGIAPLTWSPLGGGMLTGKYRRGAQGRAEALGGKVFRAENSERRTAVLDTVLDIATELDTGPDAVAIAWVAAQGGLPILGPRSLEQLQGNLRAATAVLAPEHLARLDAASAPATDDKTQPAISQSDPDFIAPALPVA